VSRRSSATGAAKAYYSAEVSRKIDAVMADAHSGRLCCRPLAAGEVELTG